MREHLEKMEKAGLISISEQESRSNIKNIVLVVRLQNERPVNPLHEHIKKKNPLPEHIEKILYFLIR